MDNTESSDQKKAVKQFIDLLNSSSPHQKQISSSTAIQYLFARKFDIPKAVALYEANYLIRQREGLYGFDTALDPLRSELETGKFTILPSRDVSGAAIALFTANLHNPQIVSHKTTLQGIVYQLDAVLQSVETQRNGLVFIYDMSGSKYSNFDYELSQKILTMLKGCYPAKLKKVLIVTAPLWFKAPFKILRLFVREKLRDRVFTVSVPQLSLHIPRDSIPIHLGGTLRIDHSSWLINCNKSMTNREEDELLSQTVESSDPDQLIATITANGNNNNNNDDDSGTTTLTINGSENNGTTAQNGTTEISTQETNGIITDIHWTATENPPSSASPSSGFSDDDSLTGGTNETGDPKTIEQVVDMVRQMGRKGLLKEYADIRAQPPNGNFDHAKLRSNLTKNRYTDVLCYDHSRVVLSNDEDDPTNDYINANFVDGYKQKNAYISTQGPLPKTTPDFWQMVWDQQCLVIVMTTKTMERGRVKCHQYWEPKEDETGEHGNFKVKTTAIDSNENYSVASLEITNIKTDETRNVSHWQFTSWPDYGVPSSAMAMLTFLQRVREKQAEMVKELGDKWAGHHRGPPIIVHCSAGIGRTGTFITLDICISRLQDVGTVDIRGTVEKIRNQRAYSIQMPDQYVFCHLALIEYALANKHLSPDIDLNGFYDEEDSD
ncbi:unnamed protein product [Chironomus riparius]|uniref:Tyrosine-protein phosphatase non-receptor type 9 n=1 Tax=Chironomus riparius TaxID=315576 RepID=A0A9P0JAY1_9DIPT|nr:unnamed protein product [Chironomus riparius]